MTKLYTGKVKLFTGEAIASRSHTSSVDSVPMRPHPAEIRTTIEQIRQRLERRPYLLPRRILLGTEQWAEVLERVRVGGTAEMPSLYTVPVLVLPMARVPDEMMFDFGQIPMPGEVLPEPEGMWKQEYEGQFVEDTGGQDGSGSE